MPTTFTWLPLASATQQIQDRLNQNAVPSYWADAEIQIYLIEALRVFNALTEWYRADYTFTASGGEWVNPSLTFPLPSPRYRTVTDSDLLTEIEYMLLEPPVGIGAWTGTTQFTIEKLQSSLSVRVNETIQHSGCNTINLNPISATPNTRRTLLPDNVLELRRVRFFALQPDNTFNIYYLKRSDLQSFHYFNSDYLQQQGIPFQWSIASEPPLAFDVDITPNTEGYYDILALISNADFSTTPTVLSVPNDWCWVAMYGALADLLSEEPESTDRQRAEYCRKRFLDGMDMMRKSNWFTQATINNTVADTPSLEKTDRWNSGSPLSTPPETGWQEQTLGPPRVVTDGIDFLNVTPTAPVAVGMVMVANAPFTVTVNAVDYVQISRDDWDQILNYCQHIATFKLGGDDFASTLPLLDEFFKYCQRRNKRTATYGTYVDVLNKQGLKQDLALPR
jgi:hypothetical protein